MIDATHDPKRRSWVESAQAPGSDFPLQNLPFGMFRSERPRLGVAIGDQILPLEGDLNGLLAQGPAAGTALRGRLSRLLGPEASAAERAETAKRLVPMSSVEMLLPVRPGDYSDFYASIHHAERVGRMLRPDQPLLPNYKYVPIGYHGRASSIVVDGTPVRRPRGQQRPDPAAPPVYAPTRSLDYELEAGFVVGGGSEQGSPVPIADAERFLFGMLLLNDWSARDLQAWEYQPLGPFLSKSFATSVSPWVVSLDALEPFRTPLAARPAGDPAPLPHLSSEETLARGAFDVRLQAFLRTRKMREGGLAPVEIASSRLRDLYWTPAQLLAHHTSNGCNLRPGDLLGSGTVSGADEGSQACLLEKTQRGSRPLALPGGEARAWLEDGDEILLRGHAEREGFVRIGFGECRGVVLPA